MKMTLFIFHEYKFIGFLIGGTGSLVPLTLKKNYFNSIGTDSVLAYDAEQQVNPTSTGKIINRYYYHTNQLGSVIAISTSTGQVIQKYTYNAYGKPYIYSGSTLTPLSNYTGTLYGNTRLYTGREYDRETGYYYLRARTYSSDLGRFLSRDPIGQNDQVNLYTYVANSPLKYTDRKGKAKLILGAIYNAKSVQINLVGRSLDNKYLGWIGAHSFIEFTITDNFGNVNSYSVGGHITNDMLDARFNDPTDVGWVGTKEYQAITTPTGMTEKEFATNIINESIFYDQNQKEYSGLSTEDGGGKSGNCNNFSTTMLARASNYSSNVLSTTQDFNPSGLNPGLGEYFVPICTE